ncbi:MAG: hypothetical protein ACI9IA_001400, partial [Enterobacterales bacterium]
SVDPFIQDPGNSQSMNPYSYIMNNPLSGTDPSGYMSDFGSGCDLICASDLDLINGRFQDAMSASSNNGHSNNNNGKKGDSNQGKPSEEINSTSNSEGIDNFSYDSRADSDASLEDKLGLMWELLVHGDVIKDSAQGLDNYYGDLPVSGMLGAEGTAETIQDLVGTIHAVSTGDLSKVAIGISSTATNAVVSKMPGGKFIKTKVAASVEKVLNKKHVLTVDGKKIGIRGSTNTTTHTIDTRHSDINLSQQLDRATDISKGKPQVKTAWQATVEGFRTFLKLFGDK